MSLASRSQIHAPACTCVPLCVSAVSAQHRSFGPLAPARIPRSSSQQQKAPARVVSRGLFLSEFSPVTSISALNFHLGREEISLPQQALSVDVICKHPERQKYTPHTIELAKRKPLPHLCHRWSPSLCFPAPGAAATPQTFVF